jgi:hypothetical protein
MAVPWPAVASAPLDPDLVRLVEALAIANARRDHGATVAQQDGKAKR